MRAPWCSVARSPCFLILVRRITWLGQQAPPRSRQWCHCSSKNPLPFTSCASVVRLRVSTKITARQPTANMHPLGYARRRGLEPLYVYCMYLCLILSRKAGRYKVRSTNLPEPLRADRRQGLKQSWGGRSCTHARLCPFFGKHGGRRPSHTDSRKDSHFMTIAALCSPTILSQLASQS